MKYLLRLWIAFLSGLMFAGGTALAARTQHPAPPPAGPAAASHTSQGGYLGIVCSDVNSKTVGDLKLKEAKGTEIINVDRDGPAGKAGLRPHDVILEVNSQPIAGEEQLRRTLHETPAGHSITLQISRDGQLKYITVQLADRATVEQNAWTQHVVIPAPQDQGEAFWGESSLRNLGNGFFSVFSSSTPSVGLELDVLGTQLADFFGVRDGQGLLVKRVAENSWASRAGIKAGDVITKANGQKIATLNEWAKMLHANRGRLVLITLIRNRKEQITTLQAGDKKSHSELVLPLGLQSISNPELAESAPLVGPGMFLPDNSDFEALQAQMEQQTALMELEMYRMEAELETMSIGSID